MADIKVGRIDHYYDNIGVAVLEVTEGEVTVGDTIKVVDKDGEERLTQVVESMEMDHEQVEEATTGDAVGLKVNEEVQEGDTVYKVE